MANIIDGKSIQDMVTHWLKTPVNGYLGVSYGQDIKSLLQNPLSDGAADALIQKLRSDVPALQIFPENAINIYSVRTPPDKLEFVIEVSGQSITVPEVR